MRYRFVMLVLASCGNSAPAGPVKGQISPRAVEPSAVVRACAMEVSCFASPPISTGGACVEQFEDGLAFGVGVGFGPSADDLQRYIACASSAPDCTTALDCASTDHGTDYCTAHPAPSCDGDVLIGCQGGWGVEQIDCAAAGLHCFASSGTAMCTDGRACSGDTPACDGDHAVRCRDDLGLESSIDCTAFGETCSDGACTATGATNACRGSDGCDGIDGHWCADTELTVDCGSFASHCEPVPGILNEIGISCVPDATACTSSTPDTCNGDALRICSNGTFVDTPCTSFGLTTCVATANDAKCE